MYLKVFYDKSFAQLCSFYGNDDIVWDVFVMG